MSVFEIIYIPEITEKSIAGVAGDGAGYFVMLPENEKESIPVIQSFMPSSVNFAGAVFPALIFNGKFVKSGVLLVKISNFRYFIQDFSSVNGRENQVATAVSRVKQLVVDDQSLLFMVFDGMIGDIGTIVDNMYLHLADQVKYGGVNAGSETFQPMPVIFDRDRTLGMAMLGMIIETSQGAILEHGYKTPEEMVAATSTIGNRIEHINWKPAFDVYSDEIKRQYGVEIDTDNFYTYAVHFPVGIVKADGDVLVRIPVGIAGDGSIYCVGEIPPNSILTLINAPGYNKLDTAERLRERIGGSSRTLIFYCAGRRMHLGQEAESELEKIVQGGEGEFAGALSLGEIGSTFKGGYPSFHNATLVCVTE